MLRLTFMKILMWARWRSYCLPCVDRVGLRAPLEHHVLRRQHFVEIALAQDHFVVVVVRQRLQQVRDHLDRLAARLRELRLVLLGLQALDALDLEIAERIVLVGLPLAVCRYCYAARLQHAHHHGSARAGQAGHDDHWQGRTAIAAQGAKTGWSFDVSECLQVLQRVGIELVVRLLGAAELVLRFLADRLPVQARTM